MTELPSLPPDPVRDAALAGSEALVDWLGRFVACRSVGADPAMEQEMEAARAMVEERLSALGFRNLRRLSAAETDAASSAPAIYGERLDAPGAPTLLVYAHYDVQPPDPLDKWSTPPFEATLRGDRLYARGISDDKGPMAVALGAIEAFVAVGGRLPVNVKLLIEGEEETGSPSLPAILEAHRDLLSADAVLSADGARWRSDLVTLNVGSRGTAGFEVRLTTAGKDLHSGRYGGIVPNALHEMARLVAGLHHADGRVAAEGFYDGVAPPAEDERAAMAEIPFDEAATFGAIGSRPLGEAGYSTLERLWLRPTLDVNGLWGGYTGAGSKTVIPAEACAKITLRLVPGQDPARAQEAVIAHLRRHAPAGARLEVLDIRGASAAYAVPPDHPLLKAAEETLEATTGQVPLRVRIGASLPLTELVKRHLGIETVMFSFAIADENFHAPDEFFRLSSIREGLTAWVEVLRRVGRIPRERFAPFTPR